MKINLEIGPDVLISDLNNDFSGLYPFLKLEFFKNSDDSATLMSAKNMLTQDLTLFGAGLTNSRSGEISVNPERKVAEIEDEFRSLYGLNVQVFRKSGSVWLETTGTDNLTLREQNNLGMEKSRAPKAIDITDIDYD
jgi:hypothetical protein